MTPALYLFPLESLNPRLLESFAFELSSSLFIGIVAATKEQISRDQLELSFSSLFIGIVAATNRIIELLEQGEIPVSVPYSLGLWLQRIDEYKTKFEKIVSFSSLFIGIVAATLKVLIALRAD